MLRQQQICVLSTTRWVHGGVGGDGARERVPSFFRGMQPIHSVVGLGALPRRTALVRRWALSLLLQPDYNLRHRFPMTEEEGEDQRRRRRRRRCLEAPSSPRYPLPLSVPRFQRSENKRQIMSCTHPRALLFNRKCV